MATTLQRRTLEHGCRPFAWLRAVAGEPYPALLESTLAGPPLGRHSILCWRPFLTVVCRGREVQARDLRTGRTRTRRGDPFRALSAEFGRLRVEAPEGFDLPFAGGAVGFLSYDLRHRIERLPRLCAYDLDLPLFALCFYDQVVIFDHARDLTEWVGLPGAEASLPEPAAGGDEALPDLPPVELKSNFTRAAYVRAVERAKEYIAAGDIYQANLSQRFSGPCPADGLAVYGRLRRMNPAPFAAYLRYPGLEVMSSSPERFLLVEDGVVTTRPIKGTRPRRAGDQAFNARMRAELLASAKDHAELAMIVDLERNDLGRVCGYGTVRVEEHAAIEEYETVFHLVSTVRGELYRPGCDEFSLLRASFPGGSVTGAPKVRAMQIIEELEPHARNIYTGAVGYISFHGRMDLNMAIRTIVRTGGRVYLGVGGGIVADSDPELEYEETLHKGRGMFEALNACDVAGLAEAAANG